MAKLEALQKNIETLRAAIPELRGVLIASTEGLPVAQMAHRLDRATTVVRGWLEKGK